MLQAMATSSQRTAQTRLADKKAAMNAAATGLSPAGSGHVSGAAGMRHFSGSGTDLSSAVMPRQINPWSLRPTDIPTSPSIHTSSAQAQYAMQQAAADLLRQKLGAQQLLAQSNLQSSSHASAAASAQRQSAQAHSASGSEEEEEDEEEDDDDDDESDGSDAEFVQKKTQRNALMAGGGGGGLRRM